MRTSGDTETQRCYNVPVKATSKIVILSIVSLFVGGAIVFAERSRPRSISIPVKGMVCEGCEQHLCDKLSAAPGVTSVSASHKEELVTIVVGGWTHANEEELRAVIKRAGYEPDTEESESDEPESDKPGTDEPPNR